MKYEILNVQEAISAGLQMPFAMIRSLSQATLGYTPSRVEEKELLDARFFSGEQEIRVFLGEEGLQALGVIGEAADHCLDETYQLENKQLGCTLKIVRVLDWDEDGQTYVVATRLADWKEAEGNG